MVAHLAEQGGLREISSRRNEPGRGGVCSRAPAFLAHPVARWISPKSGNRAQRPTVKYRYEEHGPHHPARNARPRRVDPPRRARGPLGGMRTNRPAWQRFGARHGSRDRRPSPRALGCSAGGRGPSGNDRPQADQVGPGRPIERREIGDRVLLERAVRRARPRGYPSHPRQGHHHAVRGSEPGLGSKPVSPGRRAPGSPGTPGCAARRGQACRRRERRTGRSHPAGRSERIAPKHVSSRCSQGFAGGSKESTARSARHLGSRTRGSPPVAAR